MLALLSVPNSMGVVTILGGGWAQVGRGEEERGELW